MRVNKILGCSVMLLVFSFTLLSNVNAATLRVKCETRGLTRSKISIDGAGLTGKYFALAYSGVTWSKLSRVKTADSNHEVEFDFDSNPSDIQAGATAIPATFIKAGKVLGVIRRYPDNFIVGKVAATCQNK